MDQSAQMMKYTSRSQRARQKDARWSNTQKVENGYKPWGLGTLCPLL
jgi:hypothetical protein